MSEQGTRSHQPPASAHMLQFVFGSITPQAIHVAAKLGIADLVASAPATADELAVSTGADPAALGRLLKFLASIGIFLQDSVGRFGQTPLSDTLRVDHHPQELPRRSSP